MSSHKHVALVIAGFVLTTTTSVLADFVGQTPLGPLTAGMSVTGTTSGARDLNDGWDSGTHIFDIWNGGDHVYGLNWLGGDIHLTLTSLGGSDNDLFLYVPGNLDTSSIYSLRGSDDVVELLNADAGLYYIIVDSTVFSEGDYRLDVAAIPAPGAIAVFGMALLGGRRRRGAM